MVTSQWQSASDEDWALALARAAVIRPLSDQGELTEGLVATASTELGISRSLVYRLVAKAARWTALAQGTTGSGCRDEIDARGEPANNSILIPQ